MAEAAYKQFIEEAAQANVTTPAGVMEFLRSELASLGSLNSMGNFEIVESVEDVDPVSIKYSTGARSRRAPNRYITKTEKAYLKLNAAFQMLRVNGVSLDDAIGAITEILGTFSEALLKQLRKKLEGFRGEIDAVEAAAEKLAMKVAMLANSNPLKMYHTLVSSKSLEELQAELRVVSDYENKLLEELRVTQQRKEILITIGNIHPDIYTPTVEVHGLLLESVSDRLKVLEDARKPRPSRDVSWYLRGRTVKDSAGGGLTTLDGGFTMTSFGTSSLFGSSLAGGGNFQPSSFGFMSAPPVQLLPTNHFSEQNFTIVVPETEEKCDEEDDA